MIPTAPAAPSRFPRALWFLTLAHALVDAFAAMIQPLWPDLQRGLTLNDASMQWAFILWSLATSLSQLAFGYWGDRGRGRGWLWAGIVLGVLAMSGLGLARGFPTLAALIVVGGLGIAAFHPEAAALAGASAPADRSRAMSLFSVGGYLGQAVGPVYSGLVSSRYGLSALAWSAPAGLALTVLLALAMRRDSADRVVPARRNGAAYTPPVTLAVLLRGKRRVAGVMMAVGVLRVLPATGVPLALAYVLKQRGESNAGIGFVQSVFLGGVGAGSLACALFVRRARERTVFWLLPVSAVPLLAACPAVGYAGMVACVAAVGVLIGSVMPILVGYGQRLLHDGPRVASSLTMGVTWGVGGMAVAALVAALNAVHRPDLAFAAFAVASLVSSVLCVWLPDPDSIGSVGAAWAGDAG